MVYAAGKAVFLRQAMAGGLGLAVDVARASRGRGGGGGGETDQSLYVSGALEARTGTLGLKQDGGEREEMHVCLPVCCFEP